MKIARSGYGPEGGKDRVTEDHYKNVKILYKGFDFLSRIPEKVAEVTAPLGGTYAISKILGSKAVNQLGKLKETAENAGLTVDEYVQMLKYSDPNLYEQALKITDPGLVETAARAGTKLLTKKAMLNVEEFIEPFFYNVSKVAQNLSRLVVSKEKSYEVFDFLYGVGDNPNTKDVYDPVNGLFWDVFNKGSEIVNSVPEAVKATFDNPAKAIPIFLAGYGLWKGVPALTKFIRRRPMEYRLLKEEVGNRFDSNNTESIYKHFENLVTIDKGLNRSARKQLITKEDMKEYLKSRYEKAKFGAKNVTKAPFKVTEKILSKASKPAMIAAFCGSGPPLARAITSLPYLATKLVYSPFKAFGEIGTNIANSTENIKDALLAVGLTLAIYKGVPALTKYVAGRIGGGKRSRKEKKDLSQFKKFQFWTDKLKSRGYRMKKNWKDGVNARIDRRLDDITDYAAAFAPEEGYRTRLSVDQKMSMRLNLPFGRYRTALGHMKRMANDRQGEVQTSVNDDIGDIIPDA